MAAAAQRTPLRAIDYRERHCDGGERVGDWLHRLTAGQARRIAWTGGRGVLAVPGAPLDSGGRWCAHAEVTLRQPKNRDDRPIIEVYFEQPQRGRPGAAYALRALLDTRDGPDMIRFRRDFESAWRERFPHGPPASCTD